MPPASAVQDLGLNFLLGAEYERRKQKLQQELQQDYKHHVSKKQEVKSSGAREQPETLSLPIEDRTTAKEKLREERNKEYNLFLQKQAQNRKLRRRSSPLSFTVQPSNPEHDSPPKGAPSPSMELPPPEERPPPRRDAETLTEAVDHGEHRRPRGPGHRPRRRWQIYRPRVSYYSEEEVNTEEEEEEEFDFRCRTRNGGRRGEPAQEERRGRERREKRDSGILKKTDDHAAHNPSSSDTNLEPDTSEMTGGVRTASTPAPGFSKDEAAPATGLLIGAAEDKTETQRRKERYKQELLKQIAEQQNSKIKEKTLELRVAATGATDPEKKPDRIKHLGAAKLHDDEPRRGVLLQPETELERRNTKVRAEDASGKRRSVAEPPGDPRAARAPLPGRLPSEARPALDGFSLDHHRELSQVLGEMAVRAAALDPPPAAPILPDRFTTPYDAAYYYYGSRNPLEPLHHHNHSGLPGLDQLSANVVFPPQTSSRLRSSSHAEATPHNIPSCLEFQVMSEKRRDTLRSYQEALKQQIKEKEEQKRRAKGEKERYDAKMEAEMMAYNPWGRSGGGAPIKDQQGDILSDLSQMHRFNKDSSRKFASSPKAAAPLSRQVSDCSDGASPQQFNINSKYKEALKQQMEEKRRKQEEERERIRMQEESEEQKVAAQRARMAEEYEDEQRRQEEMKRRVSNQNCTRQIDSPQQEARRTARRQKEREAEPRSAEEKTFQFSCEDRKPSPPVPALRRKQTYVASRPPSVESQQSSETARNLSAPHYRAEPQRAEGSKEEVIRELSALRRQLRREQRHLEAQMGRRSPPETPPAPSGRRRGRSGGDASEPSPKEAERRTAPLTPPVNKQHIREFNQLKHRESASREEVRTMFPDPPADAHSLDIQQQALLREQQRKIRLMNRRSDRDFLDDAGDFYDPRTRGRSFHNEPLLESETTFIGFYGDGGDAEGHQRRPPQPAAERRDRTATRRRAERDELHRTDRPAPQSAGSRTWSGGGAEGSSRRADGHSSSSSTGRRDDELDGVSLRSALERRRGSAETVATEPWLRPGTSDAVAGPNGRTEAPPTLARRAE